MKDLDSFVRALLRGSEEAKVVFEAVLIPSTAEENNDDSQDDAQNTRVLAVVSHRDDWGQQEQGSVFVCVDTSKGLAIQHIFPLTDDFTLSIGQKKRQTPIDAGVLSAAAHGTGFTLTICSTYGVDGGHPRSLTFFTQKVSEVHAMSRECKELAKPKAVDDSANSRFRWLLPYISRQDLSPTFGRFPQDLRLVNQPLHARLSPASAGMAGDDIADLQLIKYDWLRTRARAAAHRSGRRLKIRIGTFNVNGKLPSQDLASWVGGVMHPAVPPILASNDESQQAETNESEGKRQVGIKDVAEVKHVDADPFPDMLVLGFQELDLSTEALFYTASSIREDAWCQAVFAALGENVDLYEKRVSKQLVGMLLLVIVKKTLVPCFEDIRVSAVGAGILGVMGNKGGTAVQLTFKPPCPPGDTFTPGGTTLTFVNSHLAAFDEMYDKRNADFHDLSKKLLFFSDAVDLASFAQTPPPNVFETDILFWMGDLNYRVDLSDVDIRTVLAADGGTQDFNVLAKFDQLNKAIRTQKAFEGFSEHPITHFPTYRFNHTIATDGLGYDSKRKPAWTDRILYMSGVNVDVHQLTYTGHRQITMSDHKPVSADFFVDLDLFDKSIYVRTARKLFRAADLFASQRTILKPESQGVDLGSVSYERPTSKSICLQNCGKVPCAYRLVSLNFQSELHPKWLRVEPMHALMLPEEVVHLTITAYVDNNTASELNLAKKDLVATLILRTITGQDHFIMITARYQRTCFANSLSVLTRLPGPIRLITAEQLQDLEKDANPINAPREIMRLIKWLMTADPNTKNAELFTSRVDETLIDTLRECLDTGDEFPFAPQDTVAANAFATTLLRFFDSMPESLIPLHLHPKCVLVTNKAEAFELLDELPPVIVNVWIAMAALLHDVSTSAPSEDAYIIASVLAPVLLRDDPDSALPHVSPLGKRNFLLYFMN